MLPEQVRKRAERANQLIEELNGNPNGEPAPAPAPGEEPADPPNPAPAPPPEPTPAPTPAPSPTPPAEDSYEHKYRTLQGVLAAETGRLKAENRVLQDRITALEQAAAAPPPSAPAPTPPRVPFTEAERERYGDDLLNLVVDKAALMADEIVTRKLAEFTPKIQKVENDVKAVGQTVYENQEQEFWGELRDAVPDFDTVNVSNGFLLWLGQEDGVSGIRRQVLLDGAAKRLDHVRVVKLFNAYKKDAGIPVKGEAPLVSAPAPAAPPVSPSPRTVGTGGSGPTPREPQAPTVKRSEIAAHYRRSSSDPTYRTKPEYAAMEERIFQAQAANRVIDA